MINAILEGYPKSKKEFLVSKRRLNFMPPPLQVFAYFVLPSQDEVGVETDEDCKVVVPST